MPGYFMAILQINPFRYQEKPIIKPVKFGSLLWIKILSLTVYSTAFDRPCHLWKNRNAVDA